MTDYNIWIERAISSFIKASKMPYIEGLFYEDMCYDAQQAVEKSLKAFLCANDVIIKKTHDTGILHQQCVDIDNSFSKFQKICEELTIYATETRYPIRIEVDEATTERLLCQVLEIYNFVKELVKPEAD